MGGSTQSRPEEMAASQWRRCARLHPPSARERTLSSGSYNNNTPRLTTVTYTRGRHICAPPNGQGP